MQTTDSSSQEKEELIYEAYDNWLMYNKSRYCNKRRAVLGNALNMTKLTVKEAYKNVPFFFCRYSQHDFYILSTINTNQQNSTEKRSRNKHFSEIFAIVNSKT